MACAIENPDNQTVIITGGWYTLTTASVYNTTDWVKDLQPLNIGRKYHACTSFMSGETRVRYVDIVRS